MNPVEFATRKIVFDEASAITGRFDISKYRHLEKPLLDLDNIHIKRLTCIAASSSLKTVFLQIAMAYRLDQRPGSIQAVMQSDDDATDWMKTRGRKFLNRIPTLKDALSNDKFAQTNSLWMWPHQFLLVTGPGENAQQAKQVTYLFTDESHVTEFREGSLASFEERMSKRWNRQAVHCTTAADAGKEVDRFYYQGGQNEWHMRCTHCLQLFWPIWEEDAKAKYGKLVFHAAGDTIWIQCPHCGVATHDTARGRYALHEHGDYVSMNTFVSGGVESRHAIQQADSCLKTHNGDFNPQGSESRNDNPKIASESSASPAGNFTSENQSYRWNCFACHWIPWSEALSKHREAIAAARLGDLKPHENFQKKRLACSYTPQIPELGEKSGSSDYGIRDDWGVPMRKICSFDVQDEGGLHFWAQCDQFADDGSSRRVDFKRLETWQQCRDFQLMHKVRDSDTYIDAGHRDREVYAMCAKWKWFALLARDEDSFSHTIIDPRTKERRLVSRPYSTTQLQDSMTGKAGTRIAVSRGIPAGFCLSRLWSKPKIGGLLMSLKSGQSRYYGIARDISPDYVSQLKSYVYATKATKVNPLASTLYLRQVKKDDHAFSTSSMCLVGAIIAGFFPMVVGIKEEICA
jgi:hypothetical protein